MKYNYRSFSLHLEYNEMAYQNTNGRLSLIQTAFNMATLSRRRLLLYQTKTKSSSVDDGGQTSDEKVHNLPNINNQWLDNLHSDPKDDTSRSSLSKSTKDYIKSSIPVNNQKDNKAKLKTLLHSAIVSQPPEEPLPKKSISKSPSTCKCVISYNIQCEIYFYIIIRKYYA